MGIIKSFALFFLLGFILSMPSQTQAAVLSYDEAANGDINNAVFVVDFGINTVRGSTGATLVNDVTNFDFDHFEITLPSGGILGDVTLEMKAGTGFTRVPSNFEYPGHVLSFPDTLDTPFFILLTNATTVGGSRFRLQGLGFGFTDFEITMAIDGDPRVIPLPAALPLFLTGLAGLALIRRRQRQA